MMYVLHFFITDEDVPYIDHWHYLLNGDFCEFKRGGINYMSKYNEEYKEENLYFQKIRQIYTLECSIIKDEEDEDFIAFHVDW